MEKITHLIIDWGNTLMADLSGQKGPMADWPDVALMPGVEQTLPRLSRTMTLCVATSAVDSAEADVWRALTRVGIAGYFTRVFRTADIGLEKFDPAFYKEAARRMDAEPHSFCAVGNDYEMDIMPAKVAGMSTILITTQQGRYPNADIVIPVFSQLPMFVEVL